jgi:hypothetical protein
MNIKIEKATMENLPDIQNLNNKLFELELQNFDPNLIPDWPLSDAGKKYFTDMIENNFVLVAKLKPQKCRERESRWIFCRNYWNRRILYKGNDCRD